MMGELLEIGGRIRIALCALSCVLSFLLIPITMSEFFEIDWVAIIFLIPFTIICAIVISFRKEIRKEILEIRFRKEMLKEKKARKERAQWDFWGRAMVKLMVITWLSALIIFILTTNGWVFH